VGQILSIAEHDLIHASGTEKLPFMIGCVLHDCGLG